MLAELNAAQEQLRHALRMRDEFMSMVSHELRTPLNVMTLDATLRQERLNRDDLAYFTRERLQSMLARDSRQLKSMTRLISDMIDISRIQHGKLSIRPHATDLGELAAHVVADFGAHYGSVPLHLNAEPGVLGEWDESRIGQVLVNLLSNALRYGAGQPVQVDVTRTPDGMARLAVTDQGPGIPPEHQQKIFERFERLPDAGTVPGMGLGLFISRHFVQAHGGSLTVRSEPGQGACFEMVLPMAEASGR
jgi:signal transduction histidine kinase